MLMWMDAIRDLKSWARANRSAAVENRKVSTSRSLSSSEALLCRGCFSSVAAALGAAGSGLYKASFVPALASAAPLLDRAGLCRSPEHTSYWCDRPAAHLCSSCGRGEGKHQWQMSGWCMLHHACIITAAGIWHWLLSRLSENKTLQCAFKRYKLDSESNLLF